ncbi:Amino acid transporter [Macleaya cordata]|uniref:Amino acid transporter n=1 Tax=Macleaya cordata TaxID=56857 RepID=A0A200PRW1_MACCD|nr:Amino acid transporter [Macleaya cordata]
MKKASLFSLIVITALNMLCGFTGYAAFGDQTPNNLVTDYGYYSKYWLLYIANVALVINIVGAYQLFAQPIFAFVEKWAEQKWPKSKILTTEIEVWIWDLCHCKLNLFHLVWRSAFVVLTTLIPLLLPLIQVIILIFMSIQFWPLTAYFPVEMYIIHKEIPKWSTKWVGLKILSFFCLLVSVAATVSMIVFLYLDIKVYKYYHPFTSYW